MRMRVAFTCSPPISKLWNGAIQLRTTRAPMPEPPPIWMTSGPSMLTPARRAPATVNTERGAPLSNITWIFTPFNVAVPTIRRPNWSIGWIDSSAKPLCAQ